MRPAMRRNIVGRSTYAERVTSPRSSADVRHGAVFTRRWVVDLILDLADYRPGHDLTALTVIEPAIGDGAFLSGLVDRLLASREKHAPESDWSALSNCIRGWDLQPRHVRSARALATGMLASAGCPIDVARRLARAWLDEGDFLLADLDGLRADLVVGNPPYLRIEDLDPLVLAEYRRRCPTMTGRSDIYVGFYERALDLLGDDGRLAFICADRWMRNDYGRALRRKIVDGPYAVDVTLVMHDADAFESDVAAYPAITILRRGRQWSVAVGDATARFDAVAAHDFAAWTRTRRKTLDSPAIRAARLPRWHRGAESWPDGSPALVAWLDDLAERFAPLEDAATGTRIGIGVATGADRVFVLDREHETAIEPDRLLRLAHADDVRTGTFRWSGKRLINPWTEDGLVERRSHPRLSRYLAKHRAVLQQRAVVKNMRSPEAKQRAWHRTIDRVNLDLLDRPMLVMEDMKARSNPVLVPAGYYPHHGLYFLVSDTWDLDVLGGLLLSDVIERQIAAYCVKMRGNTLRFQAQYLRRVRCPSPASIPSDVADALADAFRRRDRAAATDAALRAYGMSSLPV